VAINPPINLNMPRLVIMFPLLSQSEKSPNQAVY
jgi:hypothetical protein